jgi:UDP-N-acetylmuramate dehydrogenase
MTLPENIEKLMKLPFAFCLEHVPLARYTSWKIGGPARFYVEVTTVEQLQQALAWANEHGLPVFLLGGGTNTLVLDAGYSGLVLRYRAQGMHIEDHGEYALARIDAGAPMAGTARKLARQGWAGLEWAEGVPGTIGGAVYGNAGCYGGDIASSLTRAWLLVAGVVEEWPVGRMEYGYRTSALKNQELRTKNQPNQTTDGQRTTDNGQRTTDNQPLTPVIVAAEFKLTRADPQELAVKLALTSNERRSKTPAGQSCGSVFKNPPGDSAGRLIEAAGLKGTRVGNAAISEQHANYIVNLGGASSDDVLKLIDLAQAEVLRQFGMELELEVQVV